MASKLAAVSCLRTNLRFIFKLLSRSLIGCVGSKTAQHFELRAMLGLAKAKGVPAFFEGIGSVMCTMLVHLPILVRQLGDKHLIGAHSSLQVRCRKIEAARLPTPLNL
jgi:hypothetical protein